MSNELTTANTSGLTLYAHILNASAQRWNGSAFETYVAANYANYDVAFTEQGTSGIYAGNFPSSISAGSYEIYIYQQGGGSPAQGDVVVAASTFNWNGSAEVIEPGDGIDSSIALITLAQAKAFLKITATSEDSIIATLVNAMSRLVKSYCGRDFVLASYTEDYDGSGCDKLILKHHPLTALSRVNIDPLRAFSAADASTEVVLADDVIADLPAGIIQLWNTRNFFPKGVKNVRVVYSAGYTLGTDVPDDLQHAVRLMMMYAYKRHYQDQRIGLQSETVGDHTMTYSNEDIPTAAKKILEAYKRKGWYTNGY